MKKILTVFAALLCVFALLCVGVFAAGAVESDRCIITPAEGVTASFAAGSEEKFTLTYTNNAITESGYYLVLAVKGTADNYTITEDTILYIDQAGGGKGSVTFTVYPSSLEDCVILISGTGPQSTVVAAQVTAKFTPGDVNEDGAVDGADVVLILQSASGLTKLTDSQRLAANVNGDAYVDTYDAILVLRYIAGLSIGF